LSTKPVSAVVAPSPTPAVSIWPPVLLVPPGLPVLGDVRSGGVEEDPHASAEISANTTRSDRGRMGSGCEIGAWGGGPTFRFAERASSACAGEDGDARLLFRTQARWRASSCV